MQHAAAVHAEAMRDAAASAAAAHAHAADTDTRYRQLLHRSQVCLHTCRSSQVPQNSDVPGLPRLNVFASEDERFPPESLLNKMRVLCPSSLSDAQGFCVMNVLCGL